MKIAIAGAGNMGSAILTGLKAAGQTELLALNPVNPRVSEFATANQIELVHTPTDLIAKHPAVVILTTPAPITLDVARQLADLPADTLLISAAAGVKLADLQAALPNHGLAAMIPNTPVAVNAGTIGLALGSTLTAAQTTTITELLDQLGDVIKVKEADLDIIGVVGGCGPAFVDVLMDAFADAAVKHGLNRQTAYQVVASMVKGAAVSLPPRAWRPPSCATKSPRRAGRRSRGSAPLKPTVSAGPPSPRSMRRSANNNGKSGA